MALPATNEDASLEDAPEAAIATLGLSYPERIGDCATLTSLGQHDYSQLVNRATRAPRWLCGADDADPIRLPCSLAASPEQLIDCVALTSHDAAAAMVLQPRRATPENRGLRAVLTTLDLPHCCHPNCAAGPGRGLRDTDDARPRGVCAGLPSHLDALEAVEYCGPVHNIIVQTINTDY